MGTIDKVERKPSRGPILLSGFVYPGLGQFVQRRWVAGMAYSLGFSTLFCLLIVRSFQVIFAFYRMGLEGATPTDQPSILHILGLFFVSMVVYLANVGDAYLAHRKAARRHAVNRHLDPMLASVVEEQM